MKKILRNPFEKYAESTLLIVGILALVLGAVLGYYCNARFDGVIDLHFVKAVGVYEPLLDLLVTVSVTSIALFALGKYHNPKTRLVDLVNAVLIAKIPFYLLTVFNSTGMIFNASEKIMKSVQENVLNLPDFSVLFPILIFSLITLAALVLSIVLLFQGYKVATNAKGNKSVFGFVAALLVAEIISKIIISYLP
jgi:hypothetical protein